ncbi:TIM barrel protein [Hydrogenophaga sp. BPS33]|uniref:TIM barrel protein n=1 Tax=Hydrogenophaga sp. BPS33 TaxID=2651974 RepID=UPI00131F4928|nr:TIM barrel protein [Hydrogenophaga sp. BPS33]QHE85512.1 TIM barrel protein [Hydrogenophaga sp. BPS33]
MQAQALLSFNLGIVPGVTAMFDAPTLPQRLDAARASGFTGVEGAIPADPVAMRRLLDERGMHFVCLSFARGRTEQGELGIAALPDRGEAFQASLSDVLDAAEVLGCSMVHPVAGLVSEAARVEAASAYLDRLHLACEQASLAGVNVIIEPICAARQPAFFLQTQAQALGVLQAVNAPNLRIMADMFHAGLSGESTSKLARKHPGAIGLLQVSDVPHRRQPDPADPELQATLQALAAHGWNGWISGEYVPEGDLQASLAWTRLLHEYGVGLRPQAAVDPLF